NKRRGRMLGMDPSETETGYTDVEADCPMAQMLDYSIGLRAMTKGRGSFTFEFDRYEEAPANVAQQVMAENKVADDDE
ncbi:MAG: elongation factor G, partial [Clostridia bacterium]|nr:elongation factor G [Clostridia bacterium]